MTSVFDGMAGVQGVVLGAPVDIRPGGVFDPITVRGIFRTEPISVPVADGHPMYIVEPTLKVQRTAAHVPVQGDTVEPSIAPGRRFLVLDVIPPFSPAADANVICRLEEISP